MKSFSKLSIRLKVFVFAAIAMLFLLLIGAIGYQSLNQSINSSADLTKNEYPKVLLVQKIKADSHALMRFLWTTHGLFQYAEERKNQIAEANESFKALESDLKKINQISFPADSSKTVKEINKRWVDLSVAVPKVISLFEKGTEESDKSATSVLAFEVVPQANEIYDFLKELDVKLQADINNKTALNEKNSEHLKIIIIISISASFAILIVFSFLFNSKLSGKLMSVAFDLKNAANKTEQSSADVNNASNAVTQSSQEQASAIQETVTTLDEFSSMLQLSSRNAEQSMSFSLKSKEAADEGKDVVKQVVDSIVEIKESNDLVLKQSTEGNKKIQEIVKVINEISDKTKVINDIVFQTKLLSFNASVEAARAGEHGKGFAVVAEEVGNLAIMSGNAAQEIFDMLESSISKTQDIVSHTQAEIENLMKASSVKIENGIQIAGKCDLSLDKIVENVNQVNTLVNEVVAAAKEQEIGVQQIAKAMMEIEKSTNFNTQTSNETLQYAEGLIVQSKEMMRIVSELELEIYGSKA